MGRHRMYLRVCSEGHKTYGGCEPERPSDLLDLNECGLNGPMGAYCNADIVSLVPLEERPGEALKVVHVKRHSVVRVEYPNRTFKEWHVFGKRDEPVEGVLDHG